MANVTITSGQSATIDGPDVLIQNLGPGVLYLGTGAVSAANGVKVDVGQAVKVGGMVKVVGFASGGNCDVRSQKGMDLLLPAPA